MPTSAIATLDLPTPPHSTPAYRRAIEFLLSRIDYERTNDVPYGRRGFKLDRMRYLLNLLGDPQAGQRIVHIGGTKGKGSTAQLVSAALAESGYHVGTFTSPHLDRVEERMAIDGLPCSGEAFVALVEQVRPAIAEIDRQEARWGRPTYFETTTAMALVHFAQARVGATVLEVGLGGRLDSTNVCEPRVSVMTNVSLDHTRQLGTTHAAIAREKAGIVKPGVPVISGSEHPAAAAVIRRVAAQRGSRLIELGRDFDFEYLPPRDLASGECFGQLAFRWLTNAAPRLSPPPMRLQLLGRHQAANAAVALATLEVLAEDGWAISNQAVREGFAAATCPARVEVIRRRPLVVVDAAHNVASIDALCQTLRESVSCRRRVLVFATTQDKDAAGMLHRLFPEFDQVVLTRYMNNPRFVPPEELEALAEEIATQNPLAAIPRTVCTEPAAAWRAARSLADADDLICVTGSFFIAAEVRALADADRAGQGAPPLSPQRRFRSETSGPAPPEKLE